jgi:hypothetical protein
MKNLFRPFIAVLLLTLFIAGCKKDKEETSNNQFSYNGTVFNLSQGFLENYGKSGTEGYNIDLSLLSSGFTIHNKSGEVDSVTGMGNALYFEIFTSHADKLDVRDYIYDATESGADGTFDYGMIGMGFNMETELGSAFQITGGKLSVTSVGSEYEITFTGTTSNNKAITGYYKGPLKYYNYDMKKKPLVKSFKNKSVFRF